MQQIYSRRAHFAVMSLGRDVSHVCTHVQGYICRLSGMFVSLHTCTNIPRLAEQWISSLRYRQANLIWASSFTRTLDHTDEDIPVSEN
jgi:hypothetical protein